MNLIKPEILELIISFGLFVLIWIIQVLHYPSFIYYAEETFHSAMISHQRNITFIVLPLMLMELILASFNLYKAFNSISLISLILVILIWLSTFFIQVPIHEKLLQGKDIILIYKLTQTNWIRTILWSIKFILLGLYFLRN